MRRLLRIARREYLSYLRTPGFWISLLIGPLIGGLSTAAPHIMQQATPLPSLAVLDLDHTGASTFIAQALQGPGRPAILVPAPPDVASSATAQERRQALRPDRDAERLGPGGRRLDAAAILTGTPDRVSIEFWSRDLNDASVQNVVAGAVTQSMQQARLRADGLDPRLIDALQSVRPNVHVFSPKVANSGRVSMQDRLPSLLGLGLAFVLFFSIFTGAGILLNSVIEEKSTRVLEVLLSSASVPEILGGKILGAGALSATVISGWTCMGALAARHYWPGVLGEVGTALLAHGLIAWFALFCVGGYLMYAAVFTAIGAFCETVREAQTLLGPMMLIITIPIMFLNLALQHPDAPLINILSWIPLFTPFLMTARLASGPPLWQVLGALTLMGATTTAVVWLCARAFRAGALSTGKLELRRLLPKRSSQIA